MKMYKIRRSPEAAEYHIQVFTALCNCRAIAWLLESLATPLKETFMRRHNYLCKAGLCAHESLPMQRKHLPFSVGHRWSRVLVKQYVAEHLHGDIVSINVSRTQAQCDQDVLVQWAQFVYYASGSFVSVSFWMNVRRLHLYMC